MNKKNIHQKVYLIRHGETEWTLTKRHTGLTDIPLTNHGRSQAKQMKEKLSNIQCKKILCSPLLRAKETCEITGFMENAEIDPNLVEWNYGEFEGKTTIEIHKTHPHWTIFKEGALRGESVDDITIRTGKVLEKIYSIPGDVILFSSGHFLRALGARWLTFSVRQGEHFLLSTASISILGYEKETPAFICWNVT